MNTLLFWLAATILITALMWLPYIVNLIMKKGAKAAITHIDPHDPNQLDDWARRAKAAHYNAVENLVLFAPIVIIAHILKANTGVALASVKIYFWARLLHYLAYTVGVPYARTILFFIAWASTIAITLQVLKFV